MDLDETIAAIDTFIASGWLDHYIGPVVPKYDNDGNRVLWRVTLRKGGRTVLAGEGQTIAEAFTVLHDAMLRQGV